MFIGVGVGVDVGVAASVAVVSGAAGKGNRSSRAAVEAHGCYPITCCIHVLRASVHHSIRGQRHRGTLPCKLLHMVRQSAVRGGYTYVYRNPERHRDLDDRRCDPLAK